MTQQPSTDNGHEHTPPATMRTADTANGEGPDASSAGETPATRATGEGVQHPTGERQAEENADNEPPA
jgi:hypothetical protein